jgi:AAA family ATP:ADP antiporter
MTLNGFLLLVAYSFIKPVREALLLAQQSGAEYKVYMGGATAIILTFAVPLYSAVSHYMPRNRLIVGVTLFFTSNLIIFYAFSKILGSSLAFALGFYLWIAVFNMMIIAQFWAFGNDLYVEETGERLFQLLSLGASIGGVVGAGTATSIMAHVGVQEMMLLAAALLVGSAAITQ